MAESLKKVAIVVSKGSLEGIYPALIMANGARMEGMEANLFFTFFGLDAIRKDRIDKIKVATVGNPGMHIPTWIGSIPGISWMATKMMSRQMEKILSLIHISEPTRLGMISYAVFCLKK